MPPSTTASNASDALGLPAAAPATTKPAAKPSATKWAPTAAAVPLKAAKRFRISLQGHKSLVMDEQGRAHPQDWMEIDADTADDAWEFFKQHNGIAATAHTPAVQDVTEPTAPEVVAVQQVNPPGVLPPPGVPVNTVVPPQPAAPEPPPPAATVTPPVTPAAAAPAAKPVTATPPPAASAAPAK